MGSYPFNILAHLLLTLYYIPFNFFLTPLLLICPLGLWFFSVNWASFVFVFITFDMVIFFLSVHFSTCSFHAVLTIPHDNNSRVDVEMGRYPLV